MFARQKIGAALRPLGLTVHAAVRLWGPSYLKAMAASVVAGTAHLCFMRETVCNIYTSNSRSQTNKIKHCSDCTAVSKIVVVQNRSFDLSRCSQQCGLNSILLKFKYCFVETNLGGCRKKQLLLVFTMTILGPEALSLFELEHLTLAEPHTHVISLYQELY